MAYAHSSHPVARNINPERERVVMGAGEMAQGIKLSPHNREDRSSDLLTHPKLTQKLTALV